MSGFVVRSFGDIFIYIVCLEFLVSGVEMLFGLMPFKTCPLFVLLFVSTSLSLVVWDVRRRRFFSVFFFSLFLSVSGAWETQTPFGVWVSPCVSSSRTRTTSSTRTPCSAPLARSSPARPVFFLFAARVGVFGCVSRCGVLSVCLSVCLPVHAR